MVCTLCSSEFHHLDLSSEGNNKWCKLILKYGGISVNVYLCRKCQRKIQSVHDKVTNFQALCQRSLPSQNKANNQPIKPKEVLAPIQSQCSPKLSPPTKKVKFDDHSYFKTPKPKTPKPKKQAQPVAPTAHRPITNDEYQQIHASLETRNANVLAETITETQTIEKAVVGQMINNEIKKTESLGKRKSPLSSLMTKKYNAMKQFSWSNIYREHYKMFSTLIGLMLAVALGTGHQDPQLIEKIKPKIGLIMAILLQHRHHDLSLVQRVISTILYSNLCDQKVYDRLNPLGVCLSYSRMCDVMEEISGHFNQELVKLIKNRKRFRLIGDNVNWMEKVSEETLEKRSKMKHAFGSLVITQTIPFDDVPDIPRHPFFTVPPQAFILDLTEWQAIREEYIELLSRVVCKTIHYFSDAHTATDLKGPHSDALTVPNQIIPLPLLFKNEQHYSEVVDILDFYEDTLVAAYKEADIPLNGNKVQIGGDQLTRERFSGAKRLRIKEEEEAKQLKHLSPISFEFFHLMMNFLHTIFSVLWKEDMNSDKGSMMCEKVRINRTTVNPDIRKAYDADKDFFVSFVHSHIIEATLHHFGMESVEDYPHQHEAPGANEEKPMWLKSQMGIIIDKCLPSLPTILNELHSDSSASDRQMPNSNHEPDQVNNYACQVMELGMLFISLLDVIHLPNRSRALRLLKYVMLILKHQNSRSKYALEIIRFLVHQCITLSNQEAHQMFYALFVNTKGKMTSHIAADDAMEGMVGVFKKHIHHMYSNKTEHNIQTKTSALGGVKTIADQYDITTNTIIRARKHTIASCKEDEAVMLGDLRQVRPFAKSPGRQFLSGTMVNISALTGIDAKETREWVQYKKYIYATEKGN